MILTPAIPGRQRVAGGASVPVYYPRASYDGLGPSGVMVPSREHNRVGQLPFPNGDGPTPFVPGASLVPLPPPPPPPPPGPLPPPGTLFP